MSEVLTGPDVIRKLHADAVPSGGRGGQPSGNGRDAARPWCRAVPILVAAVLALAYLIVAPNGADLPAQLFRAWLFGQRGFSDWNPWWYGGQHTLSYSILFPPLAWLLGARLLGALASVVAVAAFSEATWAVFGPRAWLASCSFAVGMTAQLVSGRLTFALGLAFAALCLWALATLGEKVPVGGTFSPSVRVGRTAGATDSHAVMTAATAVTTAALSSLASPVAGLFAALAGLTLALTGIQRRRTHARSGHANDGDALDDGGRSDCVRGIATVVAALVPVLVLEVVSPQHGSMPFALGTFWPMLAVGAALLLAVAWRRPPAAGMLALAICLYLLGCVVAFAIHTAVGSNAARLGELIAAPLALLIWPRQAPIDAFGRAPDQAPRQAFGRAPHQAPRQALDRAASPTARRTPWLLAALCLAAVPLTYIQAKDAVTDVAHGSKADSAAYYAPLTAWLRRQPGAARHGWRVEIPFTRSHWEAYYVAREVPLARGWERQTDIARNGLFYGSAPLTAATYARWLRGMHVRYVAVANTPLDYSATAEAALIRRGLPYLRLAARLPHWTVYMALTGSKED